MEEIRETEERAEACLVCGKALVYFEKAKELECEFCKERFLSHAACEDGHFICDSCHEKQGIEAIMRICMSSDSKNPVLLAQSIMANPFVYMHGPEHHILVGAVLLTAYKNCGGNIDLAEALEEMKLRGAEYPGGSCGFWGCCGAAVSAGMYMSIITGTTPLSLEGYGLSNRMTSCALAEIGRIGGPRCCKRNSFLAIRAAVSFTEKELGLHMELPVKTRCGFYGKNQECRKADCPFYPFAEG